MLLGAVPGQCQAGARQCSRPGILGPLPARAPPLRLRPWSSPRSSRPWSSRHALRSGGAACQRSGAACQAAASEFGLPPSCPDHEQRYQYFTGTLRRVVRFMGPAVLIPLGDPLMSLIDTVCIGQCAGSLELAAMGPANMIKSFATYCFQSLQVASLTLVAAALRDQRTEDAGRLLATALTLAAVFGLATTAVLLVFVQPLVYATGVRDPSLLPLATDYLRVRAVAQPAVLATMVAQAGLLAQQDSVTPSLSVLLSCCVSLLGNAVFVMWLGYGLHGAGSTTVATQVVGAAILMWALHSRHSKLRPQWGLPRAQELVPLLQTMVPLTVVSLSKNLCYLSVSTTAATLSTMRMAAHQAAFSVWCLATWTTSPLEQACMTFLPAARAQWQRQVIGRMVLGMGCIVAGTTGTLVYGLLQMPSLLVRDVVVQEYMRQIAPQAMLSLLLVGVDVAATAINLASLDHTYVARSHVITLVTIVAWFAAVRTHGWGLGGVWWGLVLFFALRAGQSSVRALRQLKLGPWRRAGGPCDEEGEEDCCASLDGPDWRRGPGQPAEVSGSGSGRGSVPGGTGTEQGSGGEGEQGPGVGNGGGAQSQPRGAGQPSGGGSAGREHG